jgi:hypothetical protein
MAAGLGFRLAHLFAPQIVPAMRRVLALVLILSLAQAARAAEGSCGAAATGIDRSLRAFGLSEDARHPFDRISIAGAVRRHPAAGLDFGAMATSAEIDAYPLTKEQRAAFDGAMAYFYKAGRENGLTMIDAVAGTAHCHDPFPFTRRSGTLKPVAAPEAEPFSLCATGGVALGFAGGEPFFAQTADDFLEQDELTLFPFRHGKLSEACVIAAHYQIVFETAERFCDKPGLCSDYAEKAASWAERLRRFGAVEAAQLAAAKAPEPKEGGDELQLFGAKESALVPEPFRFDGTESWFAVKDDPRIDSLRLGPPQDGPRMMANWEAFTLAALYKDNKPVASFVVEKRRGAYQELGLFETLPREAPPAAVVAAIYRTAAGIAGDYSHSISVLADPRGRAHYLSDRLQADLKAMDGRTPAGDAPDLDFDPISASQDPDVRALNIAFEGETAREARVRVQFHRAAAGNAPVVLRYSLTRGEKGWRVDDIAKPGKGGWRLGAILKRS